MTVHYGYARIECDECGTCTHVPANPFAAEVCVPEDWLYRYTTPRLGSTIDTKGDDRPRYVSREHGKLFCFQCRESL